LCAEEDGTVQHRLRGRMGQLIGGVLEA